ncbi:ATP-grasp domain-containing protein [Stigmatella sp. ncwal1]|uniref:ATP-grasp domain-containing protein n=1 Tax=Stigmatella ashevillensis TaxID=2995309 RepID=A0ABT5DD89_9BACT|nr:ATP-grasp domain-containing protein [Stigmatella ashevillena]MDC0711471.1 ATP-grasp domain-containing protein [Stigmatella ashevillena]
MRIGIFGEAEDPQCLAVAREAAALGAEALLFDSGALAAGRPLSLLDGRMFYLGEPVDDVKGFYLRSVPSPYVPAMERDDTLVLYEDWFTTFAQTRERAAYVLSWLLQLEHQGATLVNGPHAASMLQYKPFQLHVLRSLGTRVPRTLISNDPAAIRAFHAEVKDVIYKPVLGGALTRPLDTEALERLGTVTASPVIFQERVPGEDLRVMLVGEDIVSCVAIETPAPHLDFRSDPAYRSGQATYREVVLPEPVRRFCREAARACGLTLAGIDLKHHGDQFVFLELNSSPIYLDVEQKQGHAISRAIARRVVEAARSTPSPGP